MLIVLRAEFVAPLCRSSGETILFALSLFLFFLFFSCNTFAFHRVTWQLSCLGFEGSDLRNLCSFPQVRPSCDETG